MPEQITTATGTLWTGLTSGFMSFMNFIPSLLGAIFILVAGWFIAKFVGHMVRTILARVKLDAIAEKSHISDYLPTSGQGRKVHFSGFVAGLAKWFVFLIFVQAAAITLGVAQISTIINSIVLFIPNLLVAAAILVFGAWLSRYAYGLVGASTSKLGLASPNVPSLIVRYGIMGFACIAALSQLGVATELINILFTGLVAALAIAFGLAFGLGGKDVASDITRKMYEQGKSYRGKLNGRPTHVDEQPSRH